MAPTDEVACDMTTDAPLASFDRRVLIVAATAFAVMMALSGLYGYDRDELYFLDAARHLQGGYVDQPLLAPLLARVSLSLFGVSLPGLRIWPSMALAATVVVGGLLAREFGGGRRAQLLAAIGSATMPVVLGADHLEGPTSIDILAWATLSLIVARIGRTGNLRGWTLAGLVLGVGLANKHSIGFLAIAVFLGAILSGGWRLVLNRWLLIGALIAGAFAVPDLTWQALHGWPTIAMTRSLNAENGGAGNIPNWIVGQLIMVSLALVWVWVAGIGYLWRSGRPMWRAPRVGLRVALRVFRRHDGGEDLLPRRGVRLSARRRIGANRRLAGGTACSINAPLRVDRAHYRAGPSDRVAGPSSRRYRVDIQDQSGARRVRRLARTRPYRVDGLVLVTTSAASKGGHLHFQLRRGRRDQRARTTGSGSQQR